MGTILVIPQHWFGKGICFRWLLSFQSKKKETGDYHNE